MDVKLEAQRVMAVALGKMYNSRLQRGGIRLHRSLLLSLVLRSARDVYLNVRAEQQEAGWGSQAEAGAPAMEVEAAEGGGGGLEARPRGEVCAAQSQYIQSREECIQPQEKCIKSQECIQSQKDCIQSQEKCIQFQECIQSQKDCIEPRECVQSREQCIHSRKECIQPGSHSVQSQEDCIQRRECLQSRECIHCGRYKVSEFAQRPVAEPLAGNRCLCPGQEPRETAGSRSRKRRKGWDQREPLECLPRKRARLEEEECSREAAPDQESSSIPSLVSVFSSGFSGLLNKGQSDSPGICRDRVLSKLGIWVRAIVAY